MFEYLFQKCYLKMLLFIYILTQAEIYKHILYVINKAHMLNHSLPYGNMAK